MVHLSKGNIIITHMKTAIIQYPLRLPKMKPNILSIHMFYCDKSAILKSLVTTLPQSRTKLNITQKDIKVDCQGGTII